MTNKIKIIVIGGGAAGFFSAINMAINNPYAEVTILEAGNQPLSKVKISGGGRCNVTHNCFNASDLSKYYPRGGKELRGAFSRFQCEDTVKWFENEGVRLKIESDGRIFPVSDDSQTIIDCLLKVAKKLGIKLFLNTPVKNILKSENNFLIELKSGNFLKSNYVLIATGSNKLGYQWAEFLGHTIIKPVPSLFTFKIKDSRLENLSGISVQNVELKLLNNDKNKLTQNGALLITHWGISGPAVLKLSAWGARILAENNYKLSLKIDWLGNSYNQENLRQFLLNIKAEIPRQKVSNYSQLLPKRLWQNLVNHVNIDLNKIWAELSNKQLNLLVEEVINGVYLIEGKGIFKEEFVTCGGVSLKEINFKTMESKICPGLFFAGEILDIDGVTGGFNFQNAWTTGWLAGEAFKING